VAQEWGWHTAFYIASLPGLFLAAAAWWLIAEPPRGRHDSEASGAVPSIGAVLKRLLGLRSARQLLIGSTLASMVGFGLNAFLVFVFVRKFAMPLAQAALYSGLIGSLPGAIAVIGGGRVADWLGAKNPAAYVMVPGVALIVGGPIYMLAITRDNLATLLALLFVAGVFQYAYLGVTFGVFQNLLHSRMRATGYALLQVVYGLIGQGLGTLLVGALSDRLSPRFGSAQGLVYALLIVSVIYLWAGLHYLWAGRYLRGDLAAVRDGSAAST
jgi:MFS family permease